MKIVKRLRSVSCDLAIFRQRWRQVPPKKSNDLPIHLDIYIPQLEVTKQYFDDCGIVDQHDGSRADDIGIERVSVSASSNDRAC